MSGRTSNAGSMRSAQDRRSNAEWPCLPESALSRVLDEEGVDFLGLELNVPRIGLVADYAVHPLHVLLHARHNRRPFGRLVALRVGKHVALLAGELERLAFGEIYSGILLRVERPLTVLLKIGEQDRCLVHAGGLHARQHVLHQLERGGKNAFEHLTVRALGPAPFRLLDELRVLRGGRRSGKHGSEDERGDARHAAIILSEGGIMSTTQFDTVIIGTGQSGKPLGIALARSGLKVAVIEREHVGGTCINVGCTPTETMVASARVAYLARRSKDYGVSAAPVTVSMRRVLERKRGIVERFRSNGQRALEKTADLELIFGEARLKDARHVAVKLRNGGTRELEGGRIVINTGCRPAVPTIAGLDRIPFLDSSSIMELTELPRHLIVLGGGYAGLEFCQMFRRFGARVTVVNRDPRLILREDPDVSAEVEKILEEDGIEIINSTQVTLVEKIKAGVRVVLGIGKGSKKISGSHLLLALGRVPNSDRLNLGAAGVRTDKLGYIEVNAKLETNVPGIYAIGDVKGGPAFTHISYDDFRILRENWLNGGNATIEGRPVPNCMFIDPQLATVGLNESEAQKRGIDYRVAKLPMTGVARAQEMSETRGFMKAIVDARTQQILGCTVLGAEGGEIMSMMQIAMMGKLPYPAIEEAIFAHPTLAESLNNLFMTLDPR